MVFRLDYKELPNLPVFLKVWTKEKEIEVFSFKKTVVTDCAVILHFRLGNLSFELLN